MFRILTSDEYNILCQRYRIPKISVDFYTENYVCVPLKEQDHIRYLEISLTEYGIFRPIKENETPRIRLAKPDDTYILSDCQILENGKILVELNDNMLAARGKAKFDILLTNVSSDVEDQFVYSTKLAYMNISKLPYPNSIVESSDEFKSLNGLLLDIDRNILIVEQLNKTLTEAEAERNQNEEIRNQNEEKRQNDTATAIENLNKEKNDAINSLNEEKQNAINELNQAKQDAIDAANNANLATENATSATKNANLAAENANNAIKDANDATDRANNAAKICEDLVAGTNVILKSEKGAANGVATLDENGKIPPSQLPIYELVSETEPIEGIQSIGSFWLQEY